MMLRQKDIVVAEVYVVDPASRRILEIDERAYLTAWQWQETAAVPDLMLEFSHYIAAHFRRQGYRGIEVRARVVVALNGSKPQWLIDPRVNLAAQPRSLWPASWIVPLGEPLPVPLARSSPGN